MTEIIYKKESYAIVGACFEVYNEKGCGFLEPVYHECLTIEFEYQRIPAISKPALTLSYRGRTLLQTYQPDFICFERVVRREAATWETAGAVSSRGLAWAGIAAVAWAGVLVGGRLTAYLGTLYMQ